MSLNKFMHPRNRYKNAKPSFLHLALKYPDFRAYTTQDDKGKVFLDFKNADALRALTVCLLKEDFGLSVELPSDRLVPTLPLRLNYIHWLEDIVGTGGGKWGIDVGTGASCVYPLLAAKMNKWHFLATEADPENCLYANKNVTANGFQDLVHVKQVSTEDILIAPLESFTINSKFDFCMCNPPFFADHVEAQALTTTRSVDRPEAGSVSTASPQESIVHGGEVGFIRQMIEESAVLRDKIRVYTSMVGKKSSLAQLKAELVHQKVAKLSTTEFCQGRTMRWGIAWTYDSSVTFPRSEFEARKEKPPLSYIVPKGAGGVEYKVHEVAAYIRQILESLKVHCYQGKKAKSYTSITITAVENTWCHQRRLRRRQQREQAQQEQEKSDSKSEESKLGDAPAKHGGCVACVEVQSDKPENVIVADGINSHEVSEDSSQSSRKRSAQESTYGGNESAKRFREENDGPEVNRVETSMGSNAEQRGGQYSELNSLAEESSCSKREDMNHSSSSVSDSAGQDEENKTPVPDTSPKEYILKCVMRLKRVDEQVLLELEWLDGQSRELMHQIFTFLKNKLTQRNV